MSPEAQRVAIAEACGWTRAQTQGFVMDGWTRADEGHRRFVIDAKLPDYLNDLNAMHEAEEVLDTIPAHKGWEVYRDILQDMVNLRWDAINATAAQRAEAFLRTMNLWKDNT